MPQISKTQLNQVIGSLKHGTADECEEVSTMLHGLLAQPEDDPFAYYLIDPDDGRACFYARNEIKAEGRHLLDPLHTRAQPLQDPWRAEVKLAAVQKDTEYLDWIIDNASTAGGGDGFTLKVFVPVDCECVRTAIDKAIAGEAI